MPRRRERDAGGARGPAGERRAQQRRDLPRHPPHARSRRHARPDPARGGRDGGARPRGAGRLRRRLPHGFPAACVRGSPEVRRQVAFMRAVFASGTPAFGSCAGLQVATAAAGGTVRSNRRGYEAGFARRITRTEAGTAHPLLDGRPRAWDAPAIHSDEVDRLPDGATALAGNRVTSVQAAEIRHGGGVFWGVQYHPELPLSDIAAALRRQVDDLRESGLALDERAVETYAARVAALHHDPARRDVAWQLGLDEQVADPARRSIELRNFVEHLVKPTRSARGRA
ncbi:gamma-glutamyl-gamma-aminobutyrate hydrolase family protein [Roseomonas sp. CCTCC AB2023176]|uniref:glutamine amidotransferase-related protein n=1 Tax=Roseomonas sp. CCTCC AB2023176 TaxID=3342640 RepID=UPI0035E0F5C4